jgi:hypothetical protein
MNFWWVNHKQTREHEVRGGYMWSPFRNADNRFNQTYENMRFAQLGDVVFSFANGQIGAIGRVTEIATASPKPSEFGGVGDNWSNEGWLVGVDFRPAPKSLRTQQHATSLAPLLPSIHSPIRADGKGNQGCYLAGISNALGLLLMELLGVEEFEPIFVADVEPNAEVLADLDELARDSALRETVRIQLARARVGQGFFRREVLLRNGCCKVTGVEEKKLLIASHIKPWREASNSERLDGDNGLALSPHVDALFDDHLMSFEDNGRILIHTSLPREVLERWSIDPCKSVEKFRAGQVRFLANHRELFAKKAA